jgi:DMSO/TMAO reductase YedYZ molybdopterin-dependent catalytic subunit
LGNGIAIGLILRSVASETFSAGVEAGGAMPFLKQKDPAVPPGQTVTDGFPVLHVGDVPNIDPATWRLRIFGAVANPIDLSWEDLRSLPAAEFRGDIHCVTRWSKQNTHWVGVKFSTLVERAQPHPGAKFVVQHADNDYTTNLPLSVMLDDDVLVAYEFDGQPIEPIHGGPVRMLVPKKYFWKSSKWLNGIEFRETDQKGFWEVRGYNNDGDPWKEERYADLPAWFG